jgi:hypothetical protein
VTIGGATTAVNANTILYNFDQITRHAYYSQGAKAVDAHLTGGDLRYLCQLAHDPTLSHPTVGAPGSVDWYIEHQDPANWTFYQELCADAGTADDYASLTPNLKAQLAYVLLYDVGVNGHRATKRDAGGVFLSYVGVAQIAWSVFRPLGDWLSDQFPDAYQNIGQVESNVINGTPTAPADTTLSLATVIGVTPVFPPPADLTPDDYPPSDEGSPDDFSCINDAGGTHKC